MIEGNKARLLGGTALGVAIGIVTAVVPAVAAAQDTTNTAGEPAKPKDQKAAASNNEVEALTIVGSRIRRDNYNSPSPVEVITHEETTLAGFNSTTDALQGTAVTGGAAQINNAFGGYVTNGGQGANTLGLLGLGANRTLILLNGRRIAPAGTRGGVGSADLNVLPNAIVDHIEILKDGASSIYGSDAIAGVVNIITKQRIDYIDVEGQLNLTRSGGKRGRASIVAGHTADRWQVSGSFDYYQRDSLNIGQRDWARCGQQLFHDGNGNSTDYVNPVTGQVKCFPTGLTGDQGVTINTLGTSGAAGVPAIGSTGSTFSRWRPNINVTTGLVGYEGIGGLNSLAVRDTFEPRMLNNNIISPEKDYNLFLQGSYDLHALGNGEAYFEFLWNRRDSSQVGYRQLSIDYTKGSLLIPSSLAFSTFQSTPTLITTGPVGVRAFVGFGNDLSQQNVDSYKATSGVRGDFFMPRWKYDFTVSFSHSDGSYTFESWLTDRMKDSLTVVNAPAGFNPALVNSTGQTCASNIANPAHGCVPAPFLTPAVISDQLPQAWVNYTFVPVTGDTLYSELDSTFNIDGPIFHLPYGDLKGAFGVEYRFARINDTPPLDSQTGNLYNLTSAALTRGADHVFETYGELEAPILANLPLAHELTLNVSGRFTDYHSYGVGWTYKVSGLWAPTTWASFRATYGTSYRAPALFEQFQGGTSGFLAQNIDPCNNYQLQSPSSNLYKNCASEGLPGSVSEPFTQTVSIQTVTQGGAAQGLKAETSDNLTVGLVLQPKLPSMFGDIQFAVDYYRIQVNNSVAQVGGQTLLNLCYNSLGFRAAGGYCSYVTARGANGQGQYSLEVFDSYTNIAIEKVKGLDYTLRWTKEIGPGKLRVNALVTQYLDQSQQLTPGSGFTQYNGSIDYPKYTGTLDATYTYHKWKLRYGLDWIASMNSYDLIFGEGLGVNDTQWTYKTDNYFLHSIAVQYQGDKWEATVGIQNLTDRSPPQISAQYYDRVGTAPLYSGFDYYGRTFYINVNKRF